MRPINFTSLHDYLDKRFVGYTPNEEEIILAKKDYWRAYNTDLKRRKRKQFPVFQISLSKNDLLLLKSRLSKGQAISSYIYDLVAEHLKENYGITKSANTALFEQQLFLIAEYLRELLDREQIDTAKIERLEEYILTLEETLQELL